MTAHSVDQPQEGRQRLYVAWKLKQVNTDADMVKQAFCTSHRSVKIWVHPVFEGLGLNLVQLSLAESLFRM